jgi:hypothetical protein
VHRHLHVALDSSNTPVAFAQEVSPTLPGSAYDQHHQMDGSVLGLRWDGGHNRLFASTFPPLSSGRGIMHWSQGL